MNALIELHRIRDSGIPFEIEIWDDEFLVTLGPDPSRPDVLALTNSIQDAVGWLKEQVKLRYPHSAYARRLLIN